MKALIRLKNKTRQSTSSGMGCLAVLLTLSSIMFVLSTHAFSSASPSATQASPTDKPVETQEERVIETEEPIPYRKHPFEPAGTEPYA